MDLRSTLPGPMWATLKVSCGWRGIGFPRVPGWFEAGLKSARGLRGAQCLEIATRRNPFRRRLFRPKGRKLHVANFGQRRAAAVGHLSKTNSPPAPSMVDGLKVQGARPRRL